LLEQRLLARQHCVAGARYPCVELCKFRCGETDRTGVGLAMDEARVERRGHQRFGLLGGGVEVIAQHIVVLELKSGDAGLFRVLGLQRGDNLAAVVTERAVFVERSVVAGGDEAAVARQQRQLRRECALECLHK
jgi:hypothetical protein